MEYKNFTAKTVDEAITQACVELGVTSDRLDYDVTQEPTSGFLGIGAKPAIIRARARTEEELKKEREAIEAIEKAEKESVVINALKDKNSFKENESAKISRSAEKANAAPSSAASKGRPIITSEEIEKRAAAAAAKAKAEGREETETRPERREAKRDGGRNKNRGKDRRKDRSDRREREHYAEEIPAAERPEPSKPKPERVIKERTPEEAAVLTETASGFLKSVFDAMGIEAQISTEYDHTQGSVNCTFDGDDMGILIGKRGQTLDSLQYLTSLVVNKKADEYVRVKLDTEDYRARRADTLNNLARNIAYKVKRSHRSVALEPMNPYERRIIHSALQSNRFVETYSEGEEPYRHVVVAPKR